MQFQIPEKKLQKAFVLINQNLLAVPWLSVRQLANVCGYVNSLSLALGLVVRLFTRQMYICIESRSSWNDHVSAPLGVKEELQFWLDNLHYFNRYTILRSFTSTAILFSDASNTGYGSYLVKVGERHASGLWSENERFKSSTFRELKAIYNRLIIFSRFLQGQQLKMISDNQNVVRIFSVGSPILELHDL